MPKRGAPVLNSGFTLGPRDSMLLLLQRVAGVLLNATHGWTGADQAAYNVLHTMTPASSPTAFRVLGPSDGAFVVHIYGT